VSLVERTVAESGGSGEFLARNCFPLLQVALALGPEGGLCVEIHYRTLFTSNQELDLRGFLKPRRSGTE